MQKAGRLTTDHWTLPTDFCFQLVARCFLLSAFRVSAFSFWF
jgi:hypothetical protein